MTDDHGRGPPVAGLLSAVVYLNGLNVLNSKYGAFVVSPGRRFERFERFELPMMDIRTG
jgi:hypothetical protein